MKTDALQSSPIGEELAKLSDAGVNKLIASGQWSEDQRCVGCAFRKGTEANATPDTLAWAAQCTRTMQPFYCHCVEAIGQKVCSGWMAVVDERIGKENTKQ